MNVSIKISPQFERLRHRYNLKEIRGVYMGCHVLMLSIREDQLDSLSNEEFNLLKPSIKKYMGTMPLRTGDEVLKVKGMKPIGLIERERIRRGEVRKVVNYGIYDSKPVKTNIVGYFCGSDYYYGKVVGGVEYSEYMSEEKRGYVLGEIAVRSFVKDDTPNRYYRYLTDMCGVSASRKVLKDEEYYTHVGEEYYTDAANNYIDTMKILVHLSKLGVKKIYCPGDGLGIGVMAGIALKEEGIEIEVRGSDKYLCFKSPVELDEETQDGDFVYLYVNSYSFCGPMAGRKMIVYDRQSPQQISRERGWQADFMMVRPFIHVSSMELVSKCVFLVTAYEKERGPMVNSVYFSLGDGSPFDLDRFNVVKVLPKTVEDRINLCGNNSQMCFFQGKYEIISGKPILVLGKGRMTSYHYLSFPNDIVECAVHEMMLLELPNKVALFWSSSQLLGMENYSVRVFNREQGMAYLYYVPLKDGKVMVRVRKKDKIHTVMLQYSPDSQVKPWSIAYAKKISGFEHGLCLYFIKSELRHTNYERVSQHPDYVPEKSLVQQCQEFCSKNCNHKKKERDK